jgi:hypothetical protein
MIFFQDLTQKIVMHFLLKQTSKLPSGPGFTNVGNHSFCPPNFLVEAEEILKAYPCYWCTNGDTTDDQMSDTSPSIPRY